MADFGTLFSEGEKMKYLRRGLRLCLIISLLERSTGCKLKILKGFDHAPDVDGIETQALKLDNL